MKARELAPGIARSLSKRDLLRVVDAAYAAAPDEEQWLAGVLDAAAPTLDWGLGLCATTFSLREAVLDEKPIITGFAETGAGNVLREATRELHARAPAAELRNAHACNLVSTLSDFLRCDLAGRPSSKTIIDETTFVPWTWLTS